jgi:hydroxymethylbilane synthase
MPRRIIVGTRGSQLALWQANRVAETLRGAHAGLEVELRIIKTEGDQKADTPFRQFQGRGVFVRELEAALVRREVDLAVHSAKDVPTETAPGLALVAALPRHDPRDALVGRALGAISRGAKIGTSSPRRRAALARRRADLEFVDLRGNLDTRLRKLDEGRFEAAVLACAGLERLGMGVRIAERLAPEICLPAPGQGIVVAETRADDDEVRRLLAAISDASSLACLWAERALLEGLGGGCQVPIGALARIEGGTMRLTAGVSSPDGRRFVDGEGSGDPARGAELGREVAGRLIAGGAQEILAEGER